MRSLTWSSNVCKILVCRDAVDVSIALEEIVSEKLLPPTFAVSEDDFCILFLFLLEFVLPFGRPRPGPVGIADVVGVVGDV